jgi:hypothetical protein
MVDNQHRQIKGYRDLSQNELDQMNDIKQMEATVAQLWNPINHTNEDVDARWMRIAKTHLEEGFSAFVRAIAQPESPFDY